MHPRREGVTLAVGDSLDIVIVSHSDVFEAPQPMCIHSEERLFKPAPSQAGDSAIVPGVGMDGKYGLFLMTAGPVRPFGMRSGKIVPGRLTESNSL